jgi:hypothetical protein
MRYMSLTPPGVNFINLFMRGFFTQMTKKLKRHFRKHFRLKFGEVDAQKMVQLAKLQFAGNFLPFALRQSLMKLTPGGVMG